MLASILTLLHSWLAWMSVHSLVALTSITTPVAGVVGLWYGIPKLHRERVREKRERNIEATLRKLEQLEAATKREKGFSVSLTAVAPEPGDDPNIVAEAWKRFQNDKRWFAAALHSRFSRPRY